MASLYPFIYKLFIIAKMIKLLASLVGFTAAASIVGCASPQYDLSYNVLIDPSFTADCQQSIVAAFDAWQHIGGDGLYLSFNVSVGDPGQCNGDAAPHTICIHATTLSKMAAEGKPTAVYGFTMPQKNGGGNIDIPVDNDASLTPDQLMTVVTHETGHAMGLSHTTDSSSNVMYAGFAHAAALPTCDDFQQYIDLRGGMSFGTNPVCPNGGTYTLAGSKEKDNY